ncbi:MAG: recombinase family protein [Alphaproteobacteria bacterium]|nr:recombinase family protein [Alphaproteobacteria bacterium]
MLSEGSRSSEKFIHGIKVLMAKNYIDNLSEETRKGMFEKVQQGIWPGPAPLGYRNIRRADGKNVIEVDLDVAPKVVQLFQRYASGDVALSELVKWADSVGLRSKKGNKIHKTAIHYILRNRIYVGEFSWQGTTWPAKHQPLISRELFEKVGDRLEARALVSRNTQFREFAFSGILWCGWCASEDKTYLLVPENHKVKYTYYTCQECKKLGRVVYHREHIIEAAFLEQLKQLWIEPEVLEQLREALHASHAEIVAARNREVARLQQQIGQIQQRLDRAYDDRLDGRLSIEEYERRAQGWRDDQGRLFVELDAHAKRRSGHHGAGNRPPRTGDDGGSTVGTAGCDRQAEDPVLPDLELDLWRRGAVGGMARTLRPTGRIRDRGQKRVRPESLLPGRTFRRAPAARFELATP